MLELAKPKRVATGIFNEDQGMEKGLQSRKKKGIMVYVRHVPPKILVV